ncbi:hydrolase [Sphaerisporangium melleum]|uniref:Hydrolase n=1 Tax=Sphaerisporangium melleum TaxID=321316 RepID=A0A917RLD9_9ACTN|nr:alpha/beta hydrolase [Sphaerisporangium melleum]GGL12224.1 hydrolase [Sphaerisporangium melleum]GII74406.1 hydrolase [Sphaerisporangium melleum]
MSFASDPLAPGTHSVSIDGTVQRYHVAGTGPVCLVHSGGPGIGWEYLRMPALERHLTLVYVEPIGTGESGRLPRPQDYRIDTYARFLHGIVDHLGVPEVFLLGHSHGGFVAQRYALDHPGTLSGLVLYDTSPCTGEEFWNEAVGNLDRLPERHPGRPEAAAIPAAFRQTLAATDDESCTRGLRAILPAYFADYWAHESEFAPFREAVRVWVDPMRADEPPFDVRDRLGDIATPTLVISGAHDFICGPRWGRMLHQGTSHSRFVLLHDSGHMGHIEEPTAFASAIITFTSEAGRTA